MTIEELQAWIEKLKTNLEDELGAKTPDPTDLVQENLFGRIQALRVVLAKIQRESGNA